MLENRVYGQAVGGGTGLRSASVRAKHPYPCENIIASNYILADTQAFLDKRHRQQNKEILIRHSPGIGECFFVFKYSINRKIRKISSGGCKNASQRFVLCKGVFDRKK